MDRNLHFCCKFSFRRSACNSQKGYSLQAQKNTYAGRYGSELPIYYFIFDHVIDNAIKVTDSDVIIALKLSEEELPREIREGMERFWFDENGEITEKELSQLREYGNEIQNTMWQESSCIKKLVLRFWHCFEFPF